MYKIKENTEDFIVNEISSPKLDNSGQFSICLLKKTNYTTQRAIEHIASKLKINPKNISFAGTKDKQAITTQYISIKHTNKENISKINLKDIELTFLGYSNEPISLGMLDGNEFIITVYTTLSPNLNTTSMPNYYGEQRFSKNNIEIGRLLIKSKFKEATELILKTDSDYQEKINFYYEKNDAISALKQIPKRLLQMYAHAYQSYLWNLTVKEYIKNNQDNIKIPLVGFGTELENPQLSSIIQNIMEKESITFRDFIKKQIQDISLEGDERLAFVEIKNLKLVEKTKDKVIISFELPKASYATEAIKFLFK